VADLDDTTEVAELREAVIERRRMRGGRRSKVRDEYMRPIVDAQVGGCLAAWLQGGRVRQGGRLVAPVFD
jgi:hypothetical protein